ncbi:TPA: hypothetical protein VBO02_001232 [Streptococcus agalactiae]|uniref:OB-fold protein n=2 Tax=Streptococcus agalactiae TaxID=1311 RepID=UPI00027F0472|nr:hypothetical protein [Streptococcus agalactiae]AFQ95909.1 hypothetical protein [Streptococcus phage LYGO9]ASI65943.1 hypothetical protein GT95_04815 [Streptococcus agalactiae]EPW55062.1 hypothetical protein SAG0083_05270 [Streptococcus agalactiae LMG 15084]MBY5042927.1 hypothetical protein [Streptococcus agalactiae]MBY5044659.1 hypothetical protein [Streptococcus agalactiae]
MKKVLIFFTLLCVLSLVACSDQKTNTQSNKTTNSKQEKKTRTDYREIFDTVHDEYKDFKWVSTTGWDEKQKIKVTGKFVEARTEDNNIYCIFVMGTGEEFCAIIEKDQFDKKPIKKGDTVTIAGLAFGNNKDNPNVDKDALYAIDYSLYG